MAVQEIVNRSAPYKFIAIVFVLVAPILAGCMSAAEHRAAVSGGEGDRLTVGQVQREIRVGMSGAEVAKALGSPNIVSTDEQSREVWIYDKISTTRVYSRSSGGISALILGGGLVGGAGAVGGGAGSSYGVGAGAANTEQRTLTVLVKFGNDKKVREFAYHTSRF